VLQSFPIDCYPTGFVYKFWVPQFFRCWHRRYDMQHLVLKSNTSQWLINTIWRHSTLTCHIMLSGYWVMIKVFCSYNAIYLLSQHHGIFQCECASRFLTLRRLMCLLNMFHTNISISPCVCLIWNVLQYCFDTIRYVFSFSDISVVSTNYAYQCSTWILTGNTCFSLVSKCSNIASFLSGRTSIRLWRKFTVIFLEKDKMENVKKVHLYLIAYIQVHALRLY
jgi:hypothetical protein